jgi:arylsulfatase A-like enzyme
LKDAGYRTPLVGKWHAGYLPQYSPTRSGFEEFFGISSGGVDYFTHRDGNGDPDPRSRQLFWRIAGQRAEFLFDVVADPRGRANLSAAWDAWNATVLPEPAPSAG